MIRHQSTEDLLSKLMELHDQSEQLMKMYSGTDVITLSNKMIKEIEDELEVRIQREYDLEDKKED